MKSIYYKICDICKKDFKTTNRRRITCSSKCSRQYMKGYLKRPEVKVKIREYNQRPEIKARHKEYLHKRYLKSKKDEKIKI